MEKILVEGTMKIDVSVEKGGTVEQTSFILDQKSCDRLFDKSSIYWTKDSVYNRHLLLHHQNYFNDKLRKVGKLYLNEVYMILGMPTTAMGQMVGWIFDGNTVVDFGLTDTYNERFMSGQENVAYLNFKNLEFILGK